MLTPAARRLAALLDAWPERIAEVRVWRVDPSRLARFDDGAQHRHTVPTLVSCLAGVVRVRSGFGAVDLHPGEVLVVAPGVWHRHEPVRPGSTAIGMGSMGSWADLVLQESDNVVWGRLPVEPARNLLARVLAAESGADRVRGCRDLARQLTSEQVEPLTFPHPAVERMLARLWTRLDRGIGAADLVAASGLGRSQAYALFTNALGMSPKQAVAEARWQLAQHLLAAACPVDAVVRACGYSDRRAMARIHRRHAGRTAH